MRRSLRAALLATTLTAPAFAQDPAPAPTPVPGAPADPVPAPPAPAVPADPAAERVVLPTNAAPSHYKLEITPDVAALTFAGKAEITVEVTEATDRLVLNAKDLTVASATLDGTPAAKVETDDRLERVTFTAAAPLTPGTHTLAVAYTGRISEASSGLFVTPYTEGGRERRMLMSQFESGYARSLAPMWDEPAIKTVFELALVVPEGEQAISNTPAAGTTRLPGGLKRVAFAPTPKMSSYLLFLGAGDLERITAKTEGVEIGVVTRRGDIRRGGYALDASGPILSYYNDYFATPFPLPKLDQIAAPGAGGFGAMENWGAIFYFENALLVDPSLTTEADRQRIYGTIAHEMAHQWFGDLVTMSWWDDLWLNEGFASWMEKKATDHLHPEWHPWLQALRSQQEAMELDGRGSTHAVVQPIRSSDEAETAFDDITYDKGEAVIRMLEAYLGEDAFREGVRAYMKDHAYGNTVTEDLWRALQAASDTPVVDVARDFIRQPGIPLVTVGPTSCKDGRTLATLRQDRFAVDDSAQIAQHWRVPVVATVLDGTEPTKLVLDGTAVISVAGCGPLKVNTGNAGYFRTLYDPADFAALKAYFTRLPEGDQLGLLHDTWALASAAYQPMADYLGLTAAVSSDADPLVWLQLATTFGTIADLYRGQEGAETFSAWARARLKPQLERIGWEAGKDEAPNAGVLRAALIETLAKLGDGDTIAETQARFAAFERNPAALPGGIRRAVTRAVAMHADAAMWEKLAKRAAAAPSPLEQRFYLEALTWVEDDTLAQKSLELALVPATPRQYGPRMIDEIAKRHPDLAWRFVQANLPAIADRLDALSRAGFIPEIAGRSADGARAEELKSFFKQTLPDAPDAEMRRAVDKILSNSDVRTNRLPEINDWLGRTQ
ncbi:MAG: M1 family metallopeptidase [Alphaproteobacteria bacterium]|nr:M1 family metallopeptidase [Alphaproteobacteria bacterium]